MKVVAATCWVPIHPERGPDWFAVEWDDDRPTRKLVEGYKWTRCIVRPDETDEFGAYGQSRQED